MGSMVQVPNSSSEDVVPRTVAVAYFINIKSLILPSLLHQEV